MIFGLYTILPFAACLFWTVVMLLDWRRDNAAQHVLTAFMGASAALYLCHAAFFNHETAWREVIESVYAFCNIAVFPLYCLYICRLTNRRGLSWRHLLLLLPAVIMCVWTVGLTVFCPDDVAAYDLRVTVMRILFMVQLVPISIVCYCKLRRFDAEIANYYSDTEGRSVRLTSRMMVLLIGGALISGAANFLGREYFDETELMIGVPSMLFTVLLFGVGYVGKRQEFCIDDLLRDEDRSQPAACDAAEPAAGDVAAATSTAEDVDVVVDDEPSHIVSRLESVMSERRLYLQPYLRLSDVAMLLGVGRTTLSQRINQELHLSFSDYVNNKRVDHACRLLAEQSAVRVSLTCLAEMSGFSSDSSFYRAFRRHLGMTPRQYLSKLGAD